MIEVHGDTQLIRDFTQAGLRVGVRARSLVEDSGELVAEKMKERAPKRRPQLVPSITSEMVEPLTAEIGPENALGGGYGHIVDKGLAGRAPQPFTGPALDDSEPEILREADDMVGKLLR